MQKKIKNTLVILAFAILSQNDFLRSNEQIVTVFVLYLSFIHNSLDTVFLYFMHTINIILHDRAIHKCTRCQPRLFIVIVKEIFVFVRQQHLAVGIQMSDAFCNLLDHFLVHHYVLVIHIWNDVRIRLVDTVLYRKKNYIIMHLFKKLYYVLYI